MSVFHFLRGLFRIARRYGLIFLNSNFNVISVALLVLAFWHPLDAVTIFVLLFIISLAGAAVQIRPLPFKNLCKGCWTWLRFLMETPEEGQV
jgi:hypothetical protein